MRMFSFSNWISESRGSDESVNGVEHMMAEVKAPHVLPVADINLSKRKRECDDGTASPQLEQAPEAKRFKSVVDGAQGGGIDASRKNEIAMARGVKSSALVRDTIESQFSLDILLKHKELREINQEIAKCQAALEQLRRCHLIPYPGVEGLSMDLSNGTGPALAHQNLKPQWAPAFGITEGPYSRHYSKWLIPDPRFDGIQPEWTRTAGKTVPEGRSTRNSYSDSFAAPIKSRSRGSAGQKLHALPSGYAQSKENQGPSVLKRGDGQMVKLVCLDCKRENFGSTQGFINHCRIAHRREFKSHEEAAVQSGQPIDLNESGGIIGEEKSAAPATPVATGLVHPLIRSTPTDKASYVLLLSRIAASMEMFKAGTLPGVTSIPVSAQSIPAESHATTKASPNFIASKDTPHLSALLKKRGFDKDLSSLVAESKQTLEVEEASESESEDQAPIKSTASVPETPSGPMRMLARPGASSAPFGRPASSKGTESMAARKPGISPRLPYSTPVIDTNAANRHALRIPGSESNSDSEDTPMVDVSPSVNGSFNVDLSPNTVSSNNAPSLVSDDDDYDDADGAESEIESEKWEGEDDGSDSAEIVDVEVVRKGSNDEHAHHVMGKKERHVTFVSPVKEKSIRGKN